MINLHTNLSSLIAQYGLEKTTLNINNAIERLSTGYKINQAKDNAANYSIATNMTTKINSYQVAEENVAVASDMLQYADSLLSEISNRMERLRYLQEQAINGTYGNQSLSAINNEVNALVDEINRMYSTAEYNGIKLFAETETDANGKSVVVQDVFATETTTFAELEIGASSFSVYTSDGSLVSTYDVAEDDSLGDLISILNSEGLNANLDNGQITITSNNNKYIAGDLANSLGISITQKNYVESTTQSFDVNIPVVEETVNTVTTSTTNTIESTVTETIYTTTTTETTSTETVYVTTTVETTQTSTTETVDTVYTMKSSALTYMVTSTFMTDPVDFTDAQVASMTTMTNAINNNSITSGGTYSISTTEELIALADYVNAGNDTSGMTFVLGADIDLSSINNWTPIGIYMTSEFEGVFNGNGHIIKNLSINSTGYNQGLFGAIDSSKILNVGLEGGCVDAEGSNGMLVGRVTSYATISNCYTSGSVSGGDYAGGLIGEAYQTTLMNCYATGTVSGSQRIGGLVGHAFHSKIYNSYATGDVNGTSNVGGLAGYFSNSTVKDSYATGDVSGSASGYAGGLLGYVTLASSTSTNTINNSYSEGVVTGNTNLGLANSSDWDGTEFSYNKFLAVATNTLGDLGLDALTTLSIKDTSGNTIMSVNNTHTLQNVLDAINAIADFSAELNDGVLNITTTGANGIDTTSDFFNFVPVTTTTSSTTTTVTSTQTLLVDKVEESLVTNTIYTTTTTSTTSTSTLYETTTTSTTSTETILQTTTVSLTGSTKFEDLGVKSSIYITVYSQGTRTGFSIGKNDTVNDFYAKLAQNNIASSQAGNIVTFSGNGDSYIKSSNIEQLLKLGSVTKTEDVATLNTDSEELFYENHIYGIYAPGEIMLQVGIASDENSQLSLDVSFKLNEVNLFRNIGQDLTTDYLTKLDDVLSRINKKQTEFGAMQNRLDSALDEISIQYENLISSRSTIRDADIGEVSAQLIQQQILQQAAATLLATANQTPSIALQLL